MRLEGLETRIGPDKYRTGCEECGWRGKWFYAEHNAVREGINHAREEHQDYGIATWAKTLVYAGLNG